MRYAEVLIPLALEGSFHYRLPEELAEKAIVGMRCVVPFGSKRYYTGIIIGLSDKRPNLQISFKEVLLLPDDKPSVTAIELSLWQWLSAYYICTQGEVLRAAMPAALLPESHTVSHYNTDFEADSRLGRDEQELLDILDSAKGRTYTLDALQKAVGKRAIRAFTSLVERGAIRLEEEVKSRYKAKTEVFLRLAEPFRTDEAFAALLDSLHRAPKQSALMLRWAELMTERLLPYSSPIPQRLLAESDPHATVTLSALKKKGILLSESVTQAVMYSAGGEEYRLWEHLEGEDKAIRSAESSTDSAAEAPLPRKPLSLLYTHDFRRKEKQLLAWTEEIVHSGGQVLYLSPEANKRGGSNTLSAHMAERLGSHLLSYHAFESDAKRLEVWNRLATTEEPCVVLGVRSALFLPFRRLRLIIVDEEQEYLYKQQDPAPRFHTRQVANRLGRLHDCPVVLASATPSAEVLHQVRHKSCVLITWPDDRVRPRFRFDLEVIDMGKMRRQKQVAAGELLSSPLIAAIDETIRQKKMAVVLQNRRGFAPYIICSSCGEKLRCIHCDVSLTYHKRSGMLVCHYCGYSRPLPRICPSCKQASAAGEQGSLQPVGYGAERVEEELKKRFPAASILRMDSDMAMSRTKMDEALARLESNEVDILVGTQLIKGQPYNEQVGLVAVTQLDSILGFPDFRAYERAYQLLYQLMLRSGSSRLYAQTNNPDNPFLGLLREGDYKAFVGNQLEERQMLFFPPFSRLIRIEFRAGEESLVERIACDYASSLAPYLPEQSLSPVLVPPIARLRNAFIRELLLRIPLSSSVSDTRNMLDTIRTMLQTRTQEYKRVRILFDVDPL